MSKLKHTPGPWEMYPIDKYGHYEVRRKGDSECHWITSLINGNDAVPDLETAKDNARLIAAAPDMLEALISVAKKNKLDIESLVLVGKSLESATGQPIKEIIKDAV
jgi:hypothetical protein